MKASNTVRQSGKQSHKKHRGSHKNGIHQTYRDSHEGQWCTTVETSGAVIILTGIAIQGTGSMIESAGAVITRIVVSHKTRGQSRIGRLKHRALHPLGTGPPARPLAWSRAPNLPLCSSGTMALVEGFEGGAGTDEGAPFRRHTSPQRVLQRTDTGGHGRPPKSDTDANRRTPTQNGHTRTQPVMPLVSGSGTEFHRGPAPYHAPPINIRSSHNQNSVGTSCIPCLIQ